MYTHMLYQEVICIVVVSIILLCLCSNHSSDGELMLGGINMDHFSGEFVFARVTDEANTWQITVDS